MLLLGWKLKNSLDPVAGSEKRQRLSEPEPLEISLQQENLYFGDVFQSELEPKNFVLKLRNV